MDFESRPETFWKDSLEKHLRQIELVLKEAKTWAEGTTLCKRKGVGVSIAPLDMVYPDGKLQFFNFKNGPEHDGESNLPNHVECTNEVGNCGCCHAEFKAVIFALNSPLSGHKNLLLSTYSPCTNCAHLIAYSRVFPIVVYCIDTEHDMRGLEILKKAGIELWKMGEKSEE